MRWSFFKVSAYSKENSLLKKIYLFIFFNLPDLEDILECN